MNVEVVSSMEKTFEKWCEQLLDTGKRNRLINYKDAKLKTIDILFPEIEDVFETLTEKDSLEFYDVDLYVQEHGEDVEDEIDARIKRSVPRMPSKDILQNCSDDLGKDQILAYKNGFSMVKILSSLKKLASLSLSEKGINVLYAAFGFLKWKESENSDIWFASPLVLVPVKIENASPKKPFYLTKFDDEITTNPTLAYKFKNDFGLDLPEFRSFGNEEESIESYLKRVEDFAKEQSWKVVDDVVIGTFSFLKLNMYKDLKDNKKKMLSNKIIRKIINGKELLEDNDFIDDSDIEELFKKGDEINLHNVVDADSSQLEAIYKAKKGKSFVLQGPPGTGKSQTITNLIAEFLYEGKKVLFVSEKQAARDVVFDKLKDAQLSDFCIDMHNSNANKKEFVAELDRTLESQKKLTVANAKMHLEDLRKSKKDLDDYANALYTICPMIEKTPFQILGAISKYQKYPKFDYAIKDINKRGMDYFRKAVEEIQLFSRLKDAVGYDYHRNIWYGYKDVGASYESKLNLKKTLQVCYDFICELSKISAKITNLFDGDITIDSCAEFDSKLKLIQIISMLKTFDGNYFNRKSLKEICNKVTKYNEDKKALEDNSEIVDKLFNNEIFDLNIKQYYLRFKTDYISKFRIFNSQYRLDKKRVCQFLLDPKAKMNYGQIVSALQSVKIVQELNNKLIDQEDDIFSALKSARDYNRDYDWSVVEKDILALQDVVSDNINILCYMTGHQFENLQKGLLIAISDYDRISEGRLAFNELSNYFDGDKNINSMLFADLKNRLKTWIDDIGNIDNWLRCRESLENLEKLGLKDFVDESINNNIPRETLTETFKYTYYTQWMYEILAKNRVLHDFKRELQDGSVQTFKEKDKIKFGISKAQIYHVLSSRLSNIWNSSSGKVSLLIREVNKKKRHKPIRVLMKEIGSVIQQLKPCFLMSPLSVSTYLDYDCQFDVVIFDEASQIFPWDAIGAIARAKQVIVVGDSKQMPPTNFFNDSIINGDDDGDDYDDAVDFESILDLCMASLGCSHSLNWHYRSKSEELIAFSNKNFYGNRLITFPSARKDSDMGVQFFYVENSVYDRKNHYNIKEAEKVVDMVFEHLKTYPERSLGVITFNVAQKKLIDELINKRRLQDDTFGDCFDEKKPEYCFVRNLETVQGDERDTIIFSVGFGRGSDGKFLHNFGPLNKKGGERRLNVAVTRARMNVKLVSSIKAYDIDLDRTSAEGSMLLKKYLECAEHGIERLGKDLLVDPNAEPDSDFEVDVYDVLTDAGFKVDMQVGCSGYRIDLGVKHPTRADYVLAVECDGATYHSGKTTRDRDRLRQEVLENLGWRFYRIWSTDWFRNREVEKKRLISAVEKAIRKFNVDNDIKDDFEIKSKQKEKEEVLSEKVLNVIKEEKKEIRSFFKEYEHYNVKSQKMSTFATTIYPLVDLEGPITEGLLISKVADFFGCSNVADVSIREFYDAMKNIKDVYKINDYYVTDLDKKIEMRIPKVGDEPREIKDISVAELSSGLYVVIENNNGIPKQDMFQIIAEVLGFEKLTQNITFKLEQSLSDLLRNNKVKEVNLQYFVKGNDENDPKVEADNLGWEEQ